jgi:hypothetical protein
MYLNIADLCDQVLQMPCLLLVLSKTEEGLFIIEVKHK